jgi:hypothetical protein
LTDELLEIGATGDAFAGQRFDGRSVLVEDDALVAVARQTADDIAAHSTQADHAKLHVKSPCFALSECFPNSIRERRQAGGDVCAKVHPQDAPIAFDQNLKVAARLRRLDDTETVFLSRHV